VPLAVILSDPNLHFKVTILSNVI